MKTFTKIIRITSLLVIIAASLIAYVSCNKDKCKGVSCMNGGTCNGGTCTCVAGYAGTNCGTEIRSKFLGNWTQDEKSSVTSAAQFQVGISEGPIITEVAITNFNNSFTQPVIANLSGSDSLIIPSQTIGNNIIEGYVHYVSNSDIVVYYQVLNYVTNQLDTVNTQWGE